MLRLEIEYDPLGADEYENRFREHEIKYLPYLTVVFTPKTYTGTTQSRRLGEAGLRQRTENTTLSNEFCFMTVPKAKPITLLHI